MRSFKFSVFSFKPDRAARSEIAPYPHDRALPTLWKWARRSLALPVLMLMIATALGAVGLNESALTMTLKTNATAADWRGAIGATANNAGAATNLILLASFTNNFMAAFGSFTNYGQWGPVTRADDADVNVAFGNASQTVFNYLQVGNSSRVRQSGTIRQTRFLYGSISGLTGFYLQVWRTNAAGTYDLVGQSANLSASVVASSTNLISGLSITNVVEGDFVGVRVTFSSSPSGFFTAKNWTTGVYSRYNYSGTPTGPFAWDGQSGTSYHIPIEVFGESAPLVIVGDSITTGHPDNPGLIKSSPAATLSNAPTRSVAFQLGAALGVPFQSLGLPSDTTSGMTNRFARDVLAAYPKVCVFEGGINDLGTGVSVATVTNNLGWMYGRATNAGIKPVMFAILGWNAGSSNQMVTVDTVNAWVRDVATPAFGGLWVDARPYVNQARSSGPEGNFWDLKPAYSQDGIHYTPDGTRAIVRAILDAMGSANVANLAAGELSVRDRAAIMGGLSIGGTNFARQLNVAGDAGVGASLSVGTDVAAGGAMTAGTTLSVGAGASTNGTVGLPAAGTIEWPSYGRLENRNGATYSDLVSRLVAAPTVGAFAGVEGYISTGNTFTDTNAVMAALGVVEQVSPLKSAYVVRVNKGANMGEVGRWNSDGNLVPPAHFTGGIGQRSLVNPIWYGDVSSSNFFGVNLELLNALPLRSGGTGQTNRQNAINALIGTQAAGKYVRSDGTDSTLQNIQAGDVPTLNQNTTGTAANITGVAAIANGGTGQATRQAAINALAAASPTAGDILQYDGANWVQLPKGTSGQWLRAGASTNSWQGLPYNFSVPLTDESTAVTTGVKITAPAECDFTLSEVFLFVTTVSSSGLPTVNIKKNGTTIFSTQPTVDASENSSLSAATPPVLSTTNFTKGDTLEYIIVTAGTGTKGLKVVFRGTQQ